MLAVIQIQENYMRRISQIVDRLVETFAFFSERTLGPVQTHVHAYEYIGSDTHNSGLLAFYTPTGMGHIPADSFVMSLSSIRNLLSDATNRTGDLYLLAIAMHEMRHRLQSRTKVEMLNPSFFLPKHIAREVWKAIRVYPSADIPFELDAFTLQKLFQLVAHFGPTRGFRDLQEIGAEMLTMSPKELREFAEIK